MMAVYEISTPDGQKFRVTAPEGMSAEDAYKSFAQFVSRPPVTNEDKDPRDFLAQRGGRPGDVARFNMQGLGAPDWLADLAKWQKDASDDISMKFLPRAARGAGNTAIGLVQTIGNAVLPKSIADSQLNEPIAKEEARYQALRQLDGQSGIDAANIAGTVGASIIPMNAVSKLSWLKKANDMTGAAGVVARAGVNAGVGGATALAQPVYLEDGQSFGAEKAKQVGTGVALGAVGSPVLEGVVRGAVGAINAGSRMLRGADAMAQLTPDVIADAMRKGTAAMSADIRNALAKIDAAIESGLQGTGVRLADLSADVQANLRAQVARAVQMNLNDLDPLARGRFVDIAASGATPTRGVVTQDPVLLSREKNLAKMGANSDDPALQSLARIENQNNAALVSRLDQLGAANAPPASATSARTISAAEDFMTRKQATIKSLYDNARSMNGGEIPLNTKGQASALIKELEDAGELPALQGVGASILNIINSGVPVTIGRAEGMKKRLAAEIRKAEQAGDGNAKYALQKVYGILENAEPAVALGDDVMTAFRRARDANRSYRELVENTPALKAIEDGIEPDKFFQQFIIGSGPKGYLSNVSSLKKAIAADPEVEDMIRKSIVDHLKQKALGTTDNFSQDAFNRALNEIGDQKLRLFLGEEATAQLQQLGRAAKALQTQPKGSAVNNPNSGALVAAQANNLLSRIADSRLVGSLPFGIGPVVRGAAQSGANVQKADALRKEAELLSNPLRSPNVTLPQLMNSDDLVRRILPVTAAGTAVSPLLLPSSP